MDEKEEVTNVDEVSAAGTEPDLVDEELVMMNAQMNRKKSFAATFHRFKYLYILMIPGFIWYICFHIIPLYGLTMAFQDYKIPKGISGSEWIGFRNFILLFQNHDFPILLLNTVKISALKLFCGFPIPIILALSINAVGNKIFRKVTQTISYLPNFISWVVLFGLANILFNEYNGVVANAFEKLGWHYADVTKTPSMFVGYLVVSSIWKGMGMASIVYLAALSGVDTQLYEAARVDGASRARQMWSITLPTIAPICAIVLTLNVGSILGGDFEQIYLHQGENQELIAVSQIFDTWIYRNGIGGGAYDTATALNIFKSVFGAILILATNYAAKALGYEGIW